MSSRLEALALCAIFALSLPVGIASAQRAPNAVRFKGIILEPSGKPAPDAVVSVYTIDTKANTIVDKKTARSLADGEYDVTVTTGTNRQAVFCAESPEGVAPEQLLTHARVTLAPTTRVRLHFIDDLGHPIVHVRVCPTYFSHAGGGGEWNEAITDRWSAVTDETGTASLAGLPQGWAMSLDAVDSNYVEPDWSQTVPLAKTPSTPDAIVRIVRAGAISGMVLFSGDQHPAAGINVQASAVTAGAFGQSTVTNASGKYLLPRMQPGDYEVSVHPGPQFAEWTAIQQPATVTARTIAAKADLNLIHGALLTGKVTDTSTGRPIPSVSVLVIDASGNQQALTGSDGRYAIHVPPGPQRVIRTSSPGMTPEKQQFFDLADGETKALDFKTTAPVHSAIVTGIVVGPDGKPVAGALVIARAQQQQERGARQKTDAQGRFTFGAPGLTSDMRLYASAGKLATMTGVPAVSGREITLRLAANGRALIVGRVVDQSGKPIARARVTLIWVYSDGGGIDYGTVTTDSGGRYSIFPDTSDSDYMVHAEVRGYAGAYSAVIRIRSSKTFSVPALKLIKADSFVGGTVVDLAGNPIVGADVALANEPRKHVVTDKQGVFHLLGAPREGAVIEVQALHGRFASVQVSSARNDNLITAESADEQDADSKRFVAMRDADATNHGDGTDAHILLKSACRKAGEGGKKIFLVFHASWCGPCFMLHRFLDDPEASPIIDAHFVVQDIDIWENAPQKAWENPGGTDLYKQYGGINKDGSAQGVPYFVVLDAAGTKLVGSIGFPGGDPASTGSFLLMLKTLAPGITDTELATLRTALKRDARL